MAVFVDTGAWFAYFVRRDPDHRAATAWMRRNRQPLVTTDYILDELLTLLKMRENYRVAVAAGEALTFGTGQDARVHDRIRLAPSAH